jgi:hypothetical protein
MTASLLSAEDDEFDLPPGWGGTPPPGHSDEFLKLCLEEQRKYQDSQSSQVWQDQSNECTPEDSSEVDRRVALRQLRGMAKEFLIDKLPPHERMVMLRAEGNDLGLSLRDGEILAITAEARRDLQGKASAVTQDDELDIPDDVWLWDQVITSGTPNLLVALQKVGKTALMAGMIGAWQYGAESFLGLVFQGSCPPVIIAGTDQTLADWRSVLAPVGLMQKKPNGKWKICPPIVKLWHRSQPVYLDMPGCEEIANACEAHPGALVWCDTYAALIAPLGLDEAKPEAAEPLYNLVEMVEPFRATPLLIHHASKSRADERASNASRNSNAIPAAVSQIISLQWLEPNRKSDQRINLTTEGRNSKPVDLVIEQVKRSQWVCHGSAEDIREQQAKVKAETNLNDRQAGALRAVREAWESHQEIDASRLVELMPREFDGADGVRSARATLQQLYEKKLIDKRTHNGPETGGIVTRYRPAEQTPAYARGGVQKDPPQPPQAPAMIKASERSDLHPYSPGGCIGGASEASEPDFMDPCAQQDGWHARALELRLQGKHYNTIAITLETELGVKIMGRDVKNFLESQESANHELA